MFKKRSMLVSFVLLLAGLSFAQEAIPLQWANEPNRNMVMDAKGLPDKLDESNLVWEELRVGKYNFGIPPTIADGRVLMGSTRDAIKLKGAQGNSLICYDLYTGERLWDVALPGTTGYGLACSPIVEGKRVYVQNAVAFCLDLYGQADGNDGPFTDEAAFLNLGRELEPGDPDIIWMNKYSQAAGGIYMRHGSAGTPVIVGDQFWVPTSHGQGEVMNRHHKIFHLKLEVDDPEEAPPVRPNLIVLDKNTGELIAQDDITLPEVFHGQWSSLSAAEVDGRWLVFWGDGYGFLRAFELPEKKEGEVATLKQVWQYDGNPRHHRYDEEGNARKFPYAPWEPDKYGRSRDLGPNYHIGAPVFWEGKLYFAMGRDYNYDTKAGPGGEGSLHCIDPTGEGDISESGRVWMTTDLGRTANTLAITDEGLIFVSDNSSGLHCFDAKTGEKYWRFDLKRKNFYCAPLVADGKVFVGVNRSFFILRASKELELISENRIPGEAVAVTAIDGLLVVPTWHDIQVYAGPDFDWEAAGLKRPVVEKIDAAELSLKREGKSKIDDFGGYHLFSELNVQGYPMLSQATKITNAEEDTIYRTMTLNPHYYRFGVQPGKYEVALHYLVSVYDENSGLFSATVDGKEVVGITQCYIPLKDSRADALEVRVKTFETEVSGEELTVYFPRDLKQNYRFCAIEIRGDNGYQLGVNCGAEKDYVDKNGVEWKADRHIAPATEIELTQAGQPNQWVEVAGHILERMQAAGSEAVVKSDGVYCRNINGVVCDRGGKTFINISGLGLWEYPGLSGTMKRIDDGTYKSVMMAKQTNPYGPGFYIFNSHGLGGWGNYDQPYSLDGQTLQYNKGHWDYGAVDWTQNPPQNMIATDHHRSKLYASTTGGQAMATIQNASTPRNLSAVAALPDNVLLRCITARGREEAEAGIWRSADMGQNWERVSTVDIGHSCFPITNYRERVYLHGEAGFFISADKGKIFEKVEGAPAFSHPVLLGADDTHMLGFNADGGFESRDRGLTWKQVLQPPPHRKYMWIQDHQYYDFSWDYRNDVVYAYAPDCIYRYERR